MALLVYISFSNFHLNNKKHVIKYIRACLAVLEVSDASLQYNWIQNQFYFMGLNWKFNWNRINEGRCLHDYWFIQCSADSFDWTHDADN